MTDEPHSSSGFGAVEPELEDRLSAARPVPAAGFRGRLGRQLAAHDPGYGPRPEHLRLIVTRYLVAGAVLIALGLCAATGVL